MLLNNIARAAGDGNIALSIFHTMRADQVQPDTLCYSYHFEARFWSNSYESMERWRLRATPKNIDLWQTIGREQA